MPRQQGTSVQNKFVRGLITQNTALSFPEDAATETFNCVFDETGRVTRRLGIDVEEDYVLKTLTVANDSAYTEYLWQAVAGNGNLNIFVQQQGNILHFFIVEGSNVVGANDTGLTIDLTNHIANGSPLSPANYQCQYATGLGRLIVVNEACEPIYLTYSATAQTLEATEINILIRDFTGLDDGLTLIERPTATVNQLQTTNPQHYYNILNQGWHITDALSQWDAARTDMPSNADQVLLYRASATDAFDNAMVQSKSPGNSPAPKGHFLLSVWSPDRNSAMDAEGLQDVGGVIADVQDGVVQIGDDVDIAGTIGNFNDAPIAFDGDTTHTFATSATGAQANSWIGKSWPSGPFIITSATVYGSTDQGFISAANPSITLQLYGKQGAAPANGTDGTLLGSVSFTDTTNESAGRTITSNNTTTFWDHSWIRVVESTPAQAVAEIRFFTIEDSENQEFRIKRPSCVEFFAGRAWYAGIEAAGLSTNLYFSQIAEKSEQFGACHQKNDPTSEDFTDLLPNDGGVVNIPEMASVKRMFAYQNSLLVFATNGVWQISGSANGSFLATDFVVKRLSSIGTLSPMSFASYKGVPAWWGDDGIYTVKFDPNYGSFTVVSLSDSTIKDFVTAIPGLNRRYVKGAYDTRNERLMFLYNDDPDVTTGNLYTYTKVLCLNGLSGAFYPWTVGTQEDELVNVKGIGYIIDSTGQADSKIKFTTLYNSGATAYLTYAEERNDNYSDWGFLAQETTLPELEVDYSSYLISGYKLDGQAQRFLQSNYVFVYLEQEDDASAYVQGIWDWTNSGNSGKWSSAQQIYNAMLENRNVNFRRLKIRGKGRALQLKIYSESGKPFTIIGWSIWETVNAAL